MFLAARHGDSAIKVRSMRTFLTLTGAREYLKMIGCTSAYGCRIYYMAHNRHPQIIRDPLGQKEK